MTHFWSQPQVAIWGTAFRFWHFHIGLTFLPRRKPKFDKNNSLNNFPFFSCFRPPDLVPAESDPLSGDRPPESGGWTEPHQVGPEPAAGRGGHAGAEPALWSGPAGQHHQVTENYSGRDQPGQCRPRVFCHFWPINSLMINGSIFELNEQMKLRISNHNTDFPVGVCLCAIRGIGSLTFRNISFTFASMTFVLQCSEAHLFLSALKWNCCISVVRAYSLINFTTLVWLQ